MGDRRTEAGLLREIEALRANMSARVREADARGLERGLAAAEHFRVEAEYARAQVEAYRDALSILSQMAPSAGGLATAEDMVKSRDRIVAASVAAEAAALDGHKRELFDLVVELGWDPGEVTADSHVGDIVSTLRDAVDDAVETRQRLEWERDNARRKAMAGGADD